MHTHTLAGSHNRDDDVYSDGDGYGDSNGNSNDNDNGFINKNKGLPYSH